MIFLKLIAGKPIMNIEFSGLASPIPLPGDRLSFLTTALRCVWFEDLKFPGAFGMEFVKVRAEHGIRENLMIYGSQDDAEASDDAVKLNYTNAESVRAYPRPSFK